MIVDDQHATLAFLSSDAAYPGFDGPVERIDTHGAAVFLAGARAYKVKRAVRYDYMDFSTLERRRVACEAEVVINRRTAPSLYLGVRPLVRRPDGSLEIDGPGEPVEWLVEMQRFDQAGLLDRRARQGELDETTMIGVAEAIARLHDTAEPRPDHGGTAGMRWVVEGNTDALRADGAGIVAEREVQELDRLSRLAVDTHGSLLDRRQKEGQVRQCHGDLHLRNICTIDGQPTLFDAIEFNEELACVDVLYDFAFLLMDLAHRELPGLANAAFNRYMSLRGDWDGLALLPCFLSCRAAVRAKTSLAAVRLQENRAEIGRLERRARQYLATAIRFLRPAPPRLIAVGGPSGSGKSTLAAALAPRLEPFPGAVVLRSDVTRKALCGVPQTQPLDAAAYTEAMNRRVYERMTEQAERSVRARHPVIVDAVFRHDAERRALEEAARRTGTPFTGIWLHAPVDRLESRVRGRSGDASDATVAVLHHQLHELRAPRGWHQIDATRAPEAMRDEACSLIHATRT